MHRPPVVHLDEQLFRPGQRIAIAISGGADSVALFRALLASQEKLGLVLSIAHVHHGIRGDEADRDQAFVQALATERSLPIHLRKVDTPKHAARHGETVEEAARHLRYAFFAELIEASNVDAVATAHTLDDQAETVLHKFLRGAWTEGLGGISPVLVLAKGRIVRPLLAVARAEIEMYLYSLGQIWCEDSTNRDLAYTRNRLRHHLLPILAEYNPQLAIQMSRLATIARDEEAWWQREVNRIGRGLLLPGKPVRGGGRASSTRPDEASVAFELERLRLLEPAVRRRVLRWAAQLVGTTLDFDATERLMHLCEAGSSLKRVDLDRSVCVQRTARELQFVRSANILQPQAVSVLLRIPGEASIADRGYTFSSILKEAGQEIALPAAIIRPVRAGDRLTLRHSSGPKKVKEILERMRVPAAERASRLVVAWADRILWMEGVEIDLGSVADVPFRLEVRQTSAPS